MSTRKPWVVAALGLLTIAAVVAVVLASATVDIPSEVSLPLIVLAAIAFRLFKNKRGRVGG